MTEELNAETLREGPQLHCIMFTCQGCKHLTTEDWEEYPDGERDSGTSAWCNAGDKRNLSSYWGAHHQPPSWCPFPSPDLLSTNEQMAERVAMLEGALREISELEGEINPSNYDNDDACELNRQFCYAIVTAAAALGDNDA